MTSILFRIAELYAAETAACDGILADAALALRSLSAQAPAAETPSRVPVCRELPAVLAGARAGPLAAIAESFASFEPSARWRQNPNYTVDTIGPAFLANYGYVELVGKARPWESDRLAVGFLMLGPGAHYPPHRHPASEVYHVVSGVAEWQQGDDPRATRPVGAAIYHAPNVVHETRVLNEPLLALYCWMGDIGVAAQLIRRQFAGARPHCASREGG
jgi:mannose-6-phosphate isomerase-like protein (cupin superfamily)